MEYLQNAGKTLPFKNFILEKLINTRRLLIVGAILILEFGVFKYLYPFISFIHGDSFSYIDAAYQNFSINTYLIGYSKFLRLFSVFSTSDFALAIFQYILIQASAFYFFFTLLYFYEPKRLTKLCLLIFILFNPLFLHLANLVSSDGLFLSVSIFWFTLLLWILHRPSKNVLIWHMVVLFLAFCLRYNALIYPVISLGVFAISKLTLTQKSIGFLAGISLCVLFVLFTGNKYKKLTGHWQYSPFSGWQLANNAMYAYRYVAKSERKPVPKKFALLDKFITNHFDSTTDFKKHPLEAIEASTVYMWSASLPLFRYQNEIFKGDSGATELKKWATMAPLYKDYGLYIIRQYPLKFAQHFLWPNANKYFAPPIEFLESYNSGKTYVPIQTQVWFRYKTSTITTRMKNPKTWVLNFFPILSGAVNVTMFCCILCYIFLKGWRYRSCFHKDALLAASVWMINALFTISASSAALRFQSFPIILTTIFSILYIDWLHKLFISLTYESKKSVVLKNKIDEEKLNLTSPVS